KQKWAHGFSRGFDLLGKAMDLAMVTTGAAGMYVVARNAASLGAKKTIAYAGAQALRIGAGAAGPLLSNPVNVQDRDLQGVKLLRTALFAYDTFTPGFLKGDVGHLFAAHPLAQTINAGAHRVIQGGFLASLGYHDVWQRIDHANNKGLLKEQAKGYY